MKLARAWFGGHQCIVFTHPDGDNHAGNIHTHIVINSLRVKDEPIRKDMEDKWYWQAGYKHRATDVFVNAFKQAVMDMCRERGLNQVDLLAKNIDRVTEAEYWVERRARIEKTVEDAPLPSANKNSKAQPRDRATNKTNGASTTKEGYRYTRNAQIRNAVRKVLQTVVSFEEFCRALKTDYGIDVSIRGVNIYYKHPDYIKPINGRKLGLDFEKPVIDKAIASRGMVHNKATSIGLISELQDVARGKSTAYARKVRISNIEKLAETVAYLKRANISSLNELDAAVEIASDVRDVAYAEYSNTESELNKVNVSIKARGAYYANKHYAEGYRSAKDKSAYYSKNAAGVDAYFNAAKELKRLYGNDPVPKMDALKERKQQLETERNSRYSRYCDARLKYRELCNVKRNVKHILGKDERNRGEER
jgi:hypothetical protein